MTATAQLYVVDVQDRCLAQPAGHAGPLPRQPGAESEQQALMLVRVLPASACPLTLADAGPRKPRSPAG
ncbi:MAG: hypothetical protein ACLP0J_01150 [Solirubrobacteraceae bacterium]